jgi:hypothetical protein
VHAAFSAATREIKQHTHTCRQSGRLRSTAPERLGRQASEIPAPARDSRLREIRRFFEHRVAIRHGFFEYDILLRVLVLEGLVLQGELQILCLLKVAQPLKYFVQSTEVQRFQG